MEIILVYLQKTNFKIILINSRWIEDRAFPASVLTLPRHLDPMKAIHLCSRICLKSRYFKQQGIKGYCI